MYKFETLISFSIKIKGINSAEIVKRSFNLAKSKLKYRPTALKFTILLRTQQPFKVN